MAGNNRDLSIAWPFAPSEVKLNRDTNLIKIVAMVTMLIDHVGKVLFPQYFIMRVIGRIAFPIYAYCLSVGCVYTRDMVRYIERMVLIALISQPLYAIGLQHENSAMYLYSFAEQPVRAAVQFYVSSWRTPSILWVLTLGLIIIWSIRERRLIITLGMALFCWITQNDISYGWRGIALMVLFYLFCDKPLVSLPVVASFMFWWGLDGARYTLFSVHFDVQMFAMCALPLIYIPMNSKIRLNKWVFYLFYPAHLLLIFLLKRFVF